eukprot:1179221-Prorocentrum_minimum.AAC.3
MASWSIRVASPMNTNSCLRSPDGAQKDLAARLRASSGSAAHSSAGAAAHQSPASESSKWHPEGVLHDRNGCWTTKRGVGRLNGVLDDRKGCCRWSVFRSSSSRGMPGLLPARLSQQRWQGRVGMHTTGLFVTCVAPVATLAVQGRGCQPHEAFGAQHCGQTDRVLARGGEGVERASLRVARPVGPCLRPCSRVQHLELRSG